MMVDPRVAGTTFGLTGWTHTLLYYRNDASLAVTKTDLKPPSPFNASAYTSGRSASPKCRRDPRSALARLSQGSQTRRLASDLFARLRRLRDRHLPRFQKPAASRGSNAAASSPCCHVRGGGLYWRRLAPRRHAGHQTAYDRRLHRLRPLAHRPWVYGREAPGRRGTSAGGITDRQRDRYPSPATARRGARRRRRQRRAAERVLAQRTAQYSWNSGRRPPPPVSTICIRSTRISTCATAWKYPAVMLITGINDPRVPPQELGKFAARLQAAHRPADGRSCYASTTMPATAFWHRPARKAMRCWPTNIVSCSGSSAIRGFSPAVRLAFLAECVRRCSRALPASSNAARP